MKTLSNLLTKRFRAPKEKPQHKIDFDFQEDGLAMQAYFCPRDPADGKDPKEKKRLRYDRARLWRLFYQYELWTIRSKFKECQDRGKPFLSYLVVLLQIEQWRMDHPMYQRMYATKQFDELRDRFHARRHLYRKVDTAAMVEALSKIDKAE